MAVRILNGGLELAFLNVIAEERELTLKEKKIQKKLHSLEKNKYFYINQKYLEDK